MALYVAGDKFGVTAAIRFVCGEGGGGTAAEGEVRLNDVSGTWTWQRYDGASWVDIAALVAGNTDQFLRGDKTWKCPPINYTGEVVVDSNNPATIMIKVPTAVSSVKIKLLGGTFPTWNYTELAAHNHGGQLFPSTTHTHTVPNHNHSFSDTVTSGAASATNHTHLVSGNTGSTGVDQGNEGPESHTHTVSITSQNGGVAHTHSVSVSGNTGDAGTGATGKPSATTAIQSAGITGYTLNDTAKTTLTDAITLGFSTDNSTWTTKGKSTYASLADINNTTGTNEIDITTRLTPNMFNYIKISEPTAKKGGKIAYHIEILG
jgi:hypothetical protein